MLPPPPTFDQPASLARRLWADPVSEVLFNSAAPSERGLHEQAVLIRTREVLTRYRKDWILSQEDPQTGHIIRSNISSQLVKLDRWLFPNIVGSRLSGECVLELAKFIDFSVQVRDQWLEHMPGLRYRNEELKRGKNWSALLRPDALGLLTQAILKEKAIG
ncbi:hypothetical protein PuT2_11480 [Pusillimonas sp. T2]|nr:hypothetical protein PuT2_11480 [Pusillimonas sp. T2]